MAERPEDIQALDEIEQKAIDEATREFNNFIATLALIVELSGRKGAKEKRLSAEIKKMQAFSKDFSLRQATLAYTQQSDAILKLLGRSGLTDAQKKELLTLVNQFKLDLDGKISYLEDKAKRILIRKERQRIRERSMDFEKADEVRFLRNGKRVENFELRDSSGRILTVDVLMKVVVGEAVFGSGMAGRMSTMVENGILTGIHRSIIDDRTTPICLELDGQERDLLSDDLPPLHNGCRSWIDPIL